MPAPGTPVPPTPSHIPQNISPEGNVADTTLQTIQALLARVSALETRNRDLEQRTIGIERWTTSFEFYDLTKINSRLKGLENGFEADNLQIMKSRLDYLEHANKQMQSGIYSLYSEFDDKVKSLKSQQKLSRAEIQKLEMGLDRAREKTKDKPLWRDPEIWDNTLSITKTFLKLL
jgi:septation ring formation regulator EzrA